MHRRFLIIGLSFFIALSLSAQEYSVQGAPLIAESEVNQALSFFDEQDSGLAPGSGYASNWSIERNEEGKYLRLKFYSMLDGDKFDGLHQIIDFFLDFNGWAGSVSASDNMRILVSEGREVSGGVLMHTMEYEVKAPWPVSWAEIRERSLYRMFLSDNESQLQVSFELDENYDELKGLDAKSGYIILQHREDLNAYLVYYQMDILPDFNFFLSKTAPYVQRAMADMFSGLFER